MAEQTTLCEEREDHPAPHGCTMPSGHHGPHRCVCGDRWPNATDHEPCVSIGMASLGVVGEMHARLRCGLLDGHSGPHRYALEWTDG